jgi:DNA-binding transcriptional regulator YiaG
VKFNAHGTAVPEMPSQRIGSATFRGDFMPNHANRSKLNPSPHRNPDPVEIRAAREAAGLSPAQAAELVHASQSNWQSWESQEQRATGRRMHPGLWELFQIKLKK